MTISILIIIISVFIFSLWFKRGESVYICNKMGGYDVNEKSSWSVSVKFVFFMTMLILLQWLFLKFLLFT